MKGIKGSSGGYYIGTARGDLRRIAEILKKVGKGKSKSWIFETAIKKWASEIVRRDKSLQVKSFQEAEEVLNKLGFWQERQKQRSGLKEQIRVEERNSESEKEKEKTKEEILLNLLRGE